MRNTGDGALIGQTAEGSGDEEGEDGNDHLGYCGQYDLLKLIQNFDDRPGAGPSGGQTDQNREHQSGHHGHDGSDLQVEQKLRQVTQPVCGGLDGEIGDNDVACAHGHQRGTHRRGVGQQKGQAQHAGGVALQPGDGGSNKADDNERDTEGDQ